MVYGKQELTNNISNFWANVNRKNKKSLEDIDVPEADTVETLQAELEKATSRRDAIMAEAEIPRNP